MVVHKHIDDGIESLEQITETIDSGTENIKKQYMNIRDPENVNEKVDEEQMMENCGMENLSAHNHLE